MFIVFGTKRKTIQIGRTNTVYTCDHCHNLSQFVILSIQSWFTLFWIPIFPISTKKYYTSCTVCDRGYEISKQDIHTL